MWSNSPGPVPSMQKPSQATSWLAASALQPLANSSGVLADESAPLAILLSSLLLHCQTPSLRALIYSKRCVARCKLHA